MIRSRRARALILVMALFQLLAVPAISLAEAAEQRESVGLASHVEERTSDACKHAHGPECLLCRYLSAQRPLSPGVDSWHVRADDAGVVAPSALAGPLASVLGSGGARAPPADSSPILDA